MFCFAHFHVQCPRMCVQWEDRIVLPTNAGEVHVKNNKEESDIGNIRLMSSWSVYPIAFLTHTPQMASLDSVRLHLHNTEAKNFTRHIFHMVQTVQYFHSVSDMEMSKFLYSQALRWFSVNGTPKQWKFVWCSVDIAKYTGAPNGSVPQNVCSSGKFLLGGRFGQNIMSLEGKWCWKIGNSGCLRWFDV